MLCKALESNTTLTSLCLKGMSLLSLCCFFAKAIIFVDSCGFFAADLVFVVVSQATSSVVQS